MFIILVLVGNIYINKSIVLILDIWLGKFDKFLWIDLKEVY